MQIKPWELIVLAANVGMSLMWAVTVIALWINGADIARFHFNDYHEQAFETVFIPVMVLLGTVVLIRIARR